MYQRLKCTAPSSLPLLIRIVRVSHTDVSCVSYRNFVLVHNAFFMLSSLPMFFCPSLSSSNPGTPHRRNTPRVVLAAIHLPRGAVLTQSDHATSSHSPPAASLAANHLLCGAVLTQSDHATSHAPPLPRHSRPITSFVAWSLWQGLTPVPL